MLGGKLDMSGWGEACPRVLSKGGTNIASRPPLWVAQQPGDHQQAGLEPAGNLWLGPNSSARDLTSLDAGTGRRYEWPLRDERDFR